jgi:hypothetical protein
MAGKLRSVGSSRARLLEGDSVRRHRMAGKLRSVWSSRARLLEGDVAESGQSRCPAQSSKKTFLEESDQETSRTTGKQLSCSVVKTV